MSERGRLLILDDSQILLDRIRSRLQREGYEVTTTSGPIGAEQLRSCDLVILDFHMPGTNGGEVLRSLKLMASRFGVAPLFFLYTADKVISHEYQQLGFDGGLINKGDDESLVQQVDVALRLAKLRRRASGAPIGR